MCCNPLSFYCNTYITTLFHHQYHLSTHCFSLLYRVYSGSFSFRPVMYFSFCQGPEQIQGGGSPAQWCTVYPGENPWERPPCGELVYRMEQSLFSLDERDFSAFFVVVVNLWLDIKICKDMGWSWSGWNRRQRLQGLVSPEACGPLIHYRNVLFITFLMANLVVSELGQASSQRDVS